VRFAQIGTKAEFHGAPIQALLGDKQGRLWIGTGGGGLLRLQNGRFTVFKNQNALPSDSITALAVDDEQRLWVGTERGLVIYQNNQFTHLSQEEPFQGKQITSLFHDRVVGHCP
jgi:ligand-binding sensor domain-containing protein